MKKHQLILVSSLIFTLLFYNESVGVNLAIFGLVLTGIICYCFQDRFTSRSHLVLVVTSILSCIAFAWYGDFVSFLALALSVIFLQFKTQESNLKIIQVFPIAFLNGITSLGRMLMFTQWLPKREIKNDFAKKLIAYFIIPTVFVGLFFIVYAFGSDHFSALFTDYYLDVNFFQLVLIALLGFYLSFTFWNYWIPDAFIDYNSLLDNDFKDQHSVRNQRTFSFLDVDFERKSGEITLVLLNVLILAFIVTYNYEQFFEVVEKSKLSAATHERVNAVIFSIIMAVGVILFYFKGGFNFDAKAKKMKLLSKTWLLLNGILILSTFIKNSEYVSFFGLTYKRLGVYAFLTLAIIGLVFTFLKITKQKTNGYLFNQMVWYCYGTILLCSYVSWGNLITNYNISVNKGVEPYFLSSLQYNDEARRDYFKLKNFKGEYSKYEYPAYSREAEIISYQKRSWLSKALYYDCISAEK
jgi:Domain of unknown function (DUF4173)